MKEDAGSQEINTDVFAASQFLTAFNETIIDQDESLEAARAKTAGLLKTLSDWMREQIPSNLNSSGEDDSRKYQSFLSHLGGLLDGQVVSPTDRDAITQLQAEFDNLGLFKGEDTSINAAVQGAVTLAQTKPSDLHEYIPAIKQDPALMQVLSIPELKSWTVVKLIACLQKSLVHLDETIQKDNAALPVAA